MGRAPCCDKTNVKRGPWSPEEDTTLKAYIDQFGTGGNWIALPQKIGLKRCGKSCRLRWLNYLRPNIKHGGFSEEEDNIICSLYISIGSRWSIIAAQLPGRTDNDIKNYWNTRLKKKLLGRRKQYSNRLSSTSHEDSKNEVEHESNSYPQALSNSAIERLQLHMQLQSLQSPLSLYNSPSLFPKLHPLQEKMIQNLRSSSLMQQQPLLDQQNAQLFYEPATLDDQQDYPNPKMDALENSMNSISPSDSPMAFTTGSNNYNLFVDPKPDNIHEQLLFNAGTQPASSTFQVELDGFLNSSKSAGGFLPMELDQDRLAEFDCFKEVDGAKDSMIWWPSSDDFDSKSASLSSWGSASVLQPEMFHDYALSYNM